MSGVIGSNFSQFSDTYVYDQKGSQGGAPAPAAPSGIPAFIRLTGDLSGTLENGFINVTFKDSGVAAGSYAKVTVNSKGIVVSGDNLSSSDIPSLPMSKIHDLSPTTIVRTTQLEAAIDSLIDAAPAGIDTIGRLAAAINNDPNYHVSVTTAIGSAVSAGVADVRGQVSAAFDTLAEVETAIGRIDGPVEVVGSFRREVLLEAQTRSQADQDLSQRKLEASEVVDAAAPNKVLRLNASSQLPTSITGNASTATKLAAARTIASTGDVSWSVSFDGSGNVTSSAVLSETGVAAGTFTKVTVDAKGRVVSASTLTAADIPSLSWSKITSGKPTTIAGYGITDAVNVSVLGAAGGVATLDGTGKVPAIQLPSFVDDVLEYASFADLPASGEPSKIYTALDSNRIYRWSGSAYVEISPSPGSTDSVPEGSVNKYFTDARAQAAVTTISGNAGSATKLASARTIASTGDVSWSVSFDGSGNVTAAATLADTTVVAGTYAKVTVDSKGRVTAGASLSAADIPSLDWSKITTGRPTTIAGYGITDAVGSSDVVTVATPNKILKLDSGGLLPASITGNAATATRLQTARAINGVSFDGSADVTIKASTTNVLTRGSFLTGSNFDGSAATTWAVDATSANTASKVVARDASGNFSAGTITATLSGNASTATKLATARSLSSTGDVSWSVSFDGSGDATATAALSETGVVAGAYAKVTVDAKGRVTAGASLLASDIPSLDWSKITSGRPTTISGYGITDAINSSEVVTTATANKILKLNASSQLPASITGNAATATKLATARTINGVSFDGSANITINAVDSTPRIAASEKGVAFGVATLDANGIVLASQLPSYVDDVLEYANLAAFPATGEGSKIYVTMDTNKIYRWTGTTYIEISPTVGNSDTATKLAVARTISSTGDVSWSVSFDGSGNVTGAATLSDTTVNAGTYTKVTVDSKGRVTAGASLLASDIPTLNQNTTGNAATATKLETARILGVSGDATGSATFDGSANSNIALTLANIVTADTAAKVTFNAKGLITGTSSLAASDIPNLDWSKITSGKPTTLSGYGITDGVNSSEVVTTATAGKLLKLDANSKLPASITGNADGNAATSTKLQTARSIAMTGDVTWSIASFDGSANVTAAATLANSGVTAGTYAKVTVDAKGRVTAGASLAAADVPALDWSKITTGKPTTLSGYGITDAPSVATTNLQNGDLLSWNATTSKWVNIPQSSLSGTLDGGTF